LQNSKVGGILSIISGGIGILGFVLWIFLAIIIHVFLRRGSLPVYSPYANSPEIISIAIWIYVVLGVFCGLLGIFAIIGGIFCLRRKIWGLALAGSIAGTVTFFPVGIPAVIYTVMSRPDFKKEVPPPPPPSIFPPNTTIPD
jgi:hypothetical protein